MQEETWRTGHDTNIVQGLIVKVVSLHFILSTHEKAAEGAEQESDFFFFFK